MIALQVTFLISSGIHNTGLSLYGELWISFVNPMKNMDFISENMPIHKFKMTDSTYFYL